MAAPAPTDVFSASPDEIERRFYEALRQADLERLMALWADEPEIACVHPGGPRLIGAAAIRSSYQKIFRNGAIDVDVDAESVRRVADQSTAVHSVIERLRVSTDDGLLQVRVLATNVYLKTDLGWRLVVHHASPVASRDVHEIAEPASVLH